MSYKNNFQFKNQKKNQQNTIRDEEGREVPYLGVANPTPDIVRRHEEKLALFTQKYSKETWQTTEMIEDEDTGKDVPVQVPNNMVSIFYDPNRPDVVPAYPQPIPLTALVYHENITSEEKEMMKKAYEYTFKEHHRLKNYIANEKFKLAATFKLSLCQEIQDIMLQYPAGQEALNYRDRPMEILEALRMIDFNKKALLTASSDERFYDSQETFNRMYMKPGEPIEDFKRRFSAGYDIYKLNSIEATREQEVGSQGQLFYRKLHNEMYEELKHQVKLQKEEIFDDLEEMYRLAKSYEPSNLKKFAPKNNFYQSRGVYNTNSGRNAGRRGRGDGGRGRNQPAYDTSKYCGIHHTADHPYGGEECRKISAEQLRLDQANGLGGRTNYSYRGRGRGRGRGGRSS